jgi:hypothetical protein
MMRITSTVLSVVLLDVVIAGPGDRVLAMDRCRPVRPASMCALPLGPRGS